MSAGRAGGRVGEAAAGGLARNRAAGTRDELIARLPGSSDRVRRALVEGLDRRTEEFDASSLPAVMAMLDADDLKSAPKLRKKAEGMGLKPAAQ